MISALQSPLSAIQAYSTRIAANSNNIANSATPEFKRDRVTLSDVQPTGVKAEISKISVPGPIIYEKTSNGLEPIEQSNVDLGRELPEMMLNSHFFKANIKTLQTADELLGSVLDLKA
ncbi:MAG: flagellar basal body rod C-terminal domain-containing protein [Desulfocapsaceae bacterium]|nr:flagellar basal body rod C-terminal domain-containing protein [Desulfocapsaceae bacterium]